MSSKKQQEKYLRMTLNERIQHFFLLTSFITLVITGFALKFPEALWVRGLFNLFGENAFELRGDVHRIAAVIMVAVSFYHIFYVILSQRGRKFIIDMWFRKQDLTDLNNAFRYYIGKTKVRPKFGRFSYIEKAEYWAVAWGTIVMGATGGVLWFENTFLPVISNSGMDIATAIHYYEAILASLAIFVWHFYFVIYNPDVYPMNKAWFKGYLTREEMEHEHPLELEEIEKEQAKETKKENIRKEDTGKKDIKKKDIKKEEKKPAPEEIKIEKDKKEDKGNNNIPAEEINPKKDAGK
ncbi:MAG: cytochrome b/b6 domain-containing protein [Ignavibacteriae bacterium]|nr:MAG: cytochrome b/b6 domain-containing protein [Ignavibacteriota bacterium]